MLSSYTCKIIKSHKSEELLQKFNHNNIRTSNLKNLNCDQESELVNAKWKLTQNHNSCICRLKHTRSAWRHTNGNEENKRHHPSSIVPDFKFNKCNSTPKYATSNMFSYIDSKSWLLQVFRLVFIFISWCCKPRGVLGVDIEVDSNQIEAVEKVLLNVLDMEMVPEKHKNDHLNNRNYDYLQKIYLADQDLLSNNKQILLKSNLARQYTCQRSSPQTCNFNVKMNKDEYFAGGEIVVNWLGEDLVVSRKVSTFV